MAIVGKWSLNGNTNDSAGSNNGTASNVTWADGKSGQAGSFNGTNGNINIADSSDIRLTGNYSIGFLINRNTSSDIQRIVNKDNADNFSGGYGVYLNSNTINSTHSNGTNKNWNTTYVPTVGKWEYIVLTFDGSTRRLYAKGLFKNSIATSGNVTGESTNNLFFGTYGATTALGQYLNGYLDEVELHNTALTPAEIKNKYLSYNGFM